MKTKNITTLTDLRIAKKELKRKMSMADNKAKEGFLYSTINKLFSKIDDSVIVQNTPIASGVNTVLGFISGQAESRLKMGKAGKTIFSIAAIVVAPIIAKKIQEFVEDRF